MTSGSDQELKPWERSLLFDQFRSMSAREYLKTRKQSDDEVPFQRVSSLELHFSQSPDRNSGRSNLGVIRSRFTGLVAM